jgi:hypothetical protein
VSALKEGFTCKKGNDIMGITGSFRKLEVDWHRQQKNWQTYSSVNCLIVRVHKNIQKLKTRDFAYP